MSAISARLLPWFETHGRKDLPWQLQVTPYRVWLSEIMLQQTQVATVIPYYQRFLASFESVLSLANASQDSVMQHWAGLGYYARARNLHRCAQIVRDRHDGEFPQTLDQLTALPGIGESTAGAILSLAFGQVATILDGNVKRVLSRVYQVEGWYGVSSVMKTLWELARHQTPSQGTADYNQAMMDLGSMVCTRSRPACSLCPLSDMCQSCHHGTQALYPFSRPKKNRPLRHRWFLLHRHEDKLLLEKRPEQGIWGGLWSLPEIEQLDQLADWQMKCSGEQAAVTRIRKKLLKHQFSHFDLLVSLAEIDVNRTFLGKMSQSVQETPQYQWVERDNLEYYGLPSAIDKILSQFC